MHAVRPPAPAQLQSRDPAMTANAHRVSPATTVRSQGSSWQPHRALEACLEALRHHENPKDGNTDAEEKVAHGKVLVAFALPN